MPALLWPCLPQIFYEKAFEQTIGHKVYYTISLVLPEKYMMCSKLPFRKVLIQKPFHVRSVGFVPGGIDFILLLLFHSQA